MPFTPLRATPLAAPAVRAAIAAELKRRRVSPDDVDDLVQETLARALAAQTPPEDLAQSALLTRVIARNIAVDYIRRRMVRRRYESPAGPDDQPAADSPVLDARDPIDCRRQLELMRRAVERGRLSPRALAVVHAVSEHVPQTEIAVELGVRHQTVRNDLWRARRFFQATWTAFESSNE